MVFEDHKDGCSDSQAGGGECEAHLQVRDGGGHSVLCQVVQERAGVLQVGNISLFSKMDIKRR